MSNYPKRIACDDNTRTLSNLDQQDFHHLPYIKVKSEEEIRVRGRKRNEDVKKADKKKKEREREREILRNMMMKKNFNCQFTISIQTYLEI